MEVLALDFDGVVSDTAPECFVVGLRTYVSLQPESALASSPFAAGDTAPQRRAVEAEPLYRGFVGHMALGNRAEDFGVALAALEQQVPLPDQAAYDVFRARHSAEWLERYHARFYENRSALSERDHAGWIALMGSYPPFLEVLRRRAADAQLAIATAKDRQSVSQLLDVYGIADLFADGRVLDKETGVHKTAHLQHLQQATGVPFPAITFVDDKVNHLDSVAGLGVRCGLATWGYNGPREVELARARGYLVLTLDDAEAQLFG